MARRPLFKWIRRIWITLGVSLTVWIVWNMQPHGVPADALRPSDRLDVLVNDEVVLFHPRPGDDAKAALVFLPGGGVAPHAYVPFVRAVADAGYPAALVYLPWRLAPTDDSRAEVWRRVLGARQSWGASRPIVLGGHSRGAALSARFADEHPADLAGLLLIATTHPRDQNLSAFSAPVVKVVAEHDCVASPAAARANGHLLPSSTRWIEIAGGNHAQFGHYGSQINDCGATIAREVQQAQAVAATLELLGQAGSPPR